jgi:hypothetical protein
MPVAREPLNEPHAAHAVRGVEGQPASERGLHNPVAAPDIAAIERRYPLLRNKL